MRAENKPSLGKLMEGVNNAISTLVTVESNLTEDKLGDHLHLSRKRDCLIFIRKLIWNHFSIVLLDALSMIMSQKKAMKN